MVGIIPKSESEKGKKRDFLLYVSLVLLAASILSYFILQNFVRSSAEDLKAIEREISQKKETSQMKSFEKTALTYQAKIEDFSNIFNSRRSVSKVFTFLESNCYPQVWFSSFNFNMENGTVNLSGNAGSFTALDRQLFILKRSSFVKELNLSTISIGEGGKANFGLNISFNQNIFSFSN